MPEIDNLLHTISLKIVCDTGQGGACLTKTGFMSGAHDHLHSSRSPVAVQSGTVRTISGTAAVRAGLARPFSGAVHCRELFWIQITSLDTEADALSFRLIALYTNLSDRFQAINRGTRGAGGTKPALKASLWNCRKPQSIWRRFSQESRRSDRMWLCKCRSVHEARSLRLSE